MEIWVVYALIAAIFIAGRDFVIKGITKKYTVTEHLLYYYVLTTFFVFIYVIYKKYVDNEKIKLIETNDLWKYILLTLASAVFIAPCQILSIKNCSEPSRATSVVNLSSVFLFFVSLYFVKSVKFSGRILLGIILIISGVYLVISKT